MTSLKEQMRLLKNAGKSGVKYSKQPIGSFIDFPKEIIRTITLPFSKKNKGGKK